MRLSSICFKKLMWWYICLNSWGCLPFDYKIEVVFHLPKKLKSSYIWLKSWGHLPSKKLKSSSIFQKIEVVFLFQKYWVRLPFSKKLRSSTVFKNIEVVFHSLKNWGRLPFVKLIEVIFQLLWAYLINIHWEMMENKLSRAGGGGWVCGWINWK